MRTAFKQAIALTTRRRHSPCSPRRAAVRSRHRRISRRPSRRLKIAMIAKSSTNPVFLSARTGAEAAAKELTAKHGVPVEIAWLTPPSRGRTGSGAAHRAGRQRGRERDPRLVLRRGQGHRRHQRRRRARRAGHDVRQRCARIAALRVLRCRRHQDRAVGDGRAREADGRGRVDRDPRRQSERAEPAQPRRGREAGSRRSIRRSRSSTPSTTSRRRRTPPPKSCACRTRIRRFRAGR